MDIDKKNDQLKDELAKIIVSRPDILQFAKDRKYEEAWTILLDQARPTAKEISEYLSKEKFGILIVEYIWNSNDDDNRFVLTIFLDKKCKLQDPKIFAEICLNNFYQYKDFTSLTDSFDHEVVGHPYLFKYKVEAVILSIMNFWLSAIPVELWEGGENLNLESIRNMINARPTIRSTRLNYQALLFRFNVSGEFNGPVYGIHTPCCDKENSEWVINFEKLEKYLRLLLD